LVGAFDTNPSAAPLTGSIAKRLHPDTEKSRRASAYDGLWPVQIRAFNASILRGFQRGPTMRSLIIMTILCLISTPTFACVFHKDCKPGSTCVDGVCSDELRVTTMTTCLRVTLTTMSHEASDWEDLEDLRRRQRLQPRFPLHQGFRPPGCPPRPLTASRDGTYGGIAGDPALHQKKKPGNGPDFSAV